MYQHLILTRDSSLGISRIQTSRLINLTLISKFYIFHSKVKIEYEFGGFSELLPVISC
ncbi:hypothetical protein CDL12_20999 [Handroanthus impetiginosus]|uniref:Uncharacterized protein n=1 Tax=Handroanthus impetiginosus TaxID=429701 RepID=A0A2G9GMK2_9LAMI|nr:hypothetical protein CDL12_20999 [Handroanthus impetiginosus]